MSQEMKEKIDVEEEFGKEESESRNWSQEFTVAGEELVGFVKNLVRETNVRRIIIKNEAKRVHFEVPMVLGVVGIALLPAYAALALIAALVTECQIEVIRVEEKPTASVN